MEISQTICNVNKQRKLFNDDLLAGAWDATAAIERTPENTFRVQAKLISLKSNCSSSPISQLRLARNTQEACSEGQSKMSWEAKRLRDRSLTFPFTCVAYSHCFACVRAFRCVGTRVWKLSLFRQNDSYPRSLLETFLMCWARASRVYTFGFFVCLHGLFCRSDRETRPYSLLFGLI